MMPDISGWYVAFHTTPEGAVCLEDALDMAFALDETPPTISSFEIEEHISWQVDIFFAEKPDPDRLAKAVAQAREICALDLAEPVLLPVANKDWVSESQKLLVPVEAGRIFVHGSHDRDKRRPYGINLQIEAGQAFGTGQHATTKGCLLMLDRLARRARPAKMLDIGCGSGVLAMAMAKLWHKAVLASDIDPIAESVTAQNTAINALPQLGDPARGFGLCSLSAPGVHHLKIQSAAPYDLIVANILAGPLARMAQDISMCLAPGGFLILAGLLSKQEARLAAAYRTHGVIRYDRLQIGDWPTLLLRKGKAC